MGTAPVPRQPACGVCGHEQHLLPCDTCPCTDAPVPGVYVDPWPPYLGD